MEQNGEGYISIRYKKVDYKNLYLQTYSKQKVWEQAVEIFKDRMQGRFFDVIKSLLNEPDKNGFVIMAIDCLLVETFCQFREGKKYTPKPNKRVYSKFLKKEFPNIFNDNIAQIFYNDIRCGILHSAQTKNGSQLTYGNCDVVVLFEEDKIRVDVVKFSIVLEDYYKKYVQDLLCSDKEDVRKKFIAKMGHICRCES